MKNLHIENSYNIWDIIDMKEIIEHACLKEYCSYNLILSYKCSAKTAVQYLEIPKMP